MGSMMHPKTESHAVTLTAWLMLLGFWLFLSGFPCRNFKTAWYAAASESYVYKVDTIQRHLQSKKQSAGDL